MDTNSKKARLMNMEYEISYIGDSSVADVHHIGINYNGNYYSVIFGR